MNKNIYPYTSKDISPMKCIKCNKEIYLLHSEHNGLPEEELWKNGTILKIQPGFGSILDTDTYLIGICDDCLEKARNNGNAIFLYDYISNSNEFDEKQRKKYNKNLHRKLKIRTILNEKKFNRK